MAGVGHQPSSPSTAPSGRQRVEIEYLGRALVLRSNQMIQSLRARPKHAARREGLHCIMCLSLCTSVRFLPFAPSRGSGTCRLPTRGNPLGPTALHWTGSVRLARVRLFRVGRVSTSRTSWCSFGGAVTIPPSIGQLLRFHGKGAALPSTRPNASSGSPPGAPRHQSLPAGCSSRPSLARPASRREPRHPFEIQESLN